MIEYLLYFFPNFLYIQLSAIKYITIRFGLSIATSFILMILVMPKGIKWLKSIQKDGQPIRSDGPESHLLKKGTPTMGGIFIISSILISSILWCDIIEPKIWITLVMILIFCVIGFFDDYAKLTKKSSRGIRGKWKFLTEIVISIALISSMYIFSPQDMDGRLYFPVFKDLSLYLGIFYILFSSIVITGSSNSVNLTDGLDGLVSMPIILTAFAFSIIAYVSGNSIYSSYLHIIHVVGSGELSIICGSIIGACLGFLWFNSKPADVFMGDTGSLGLGAGIGTIAVLTKHELILFVVGFLFVIEAMSVIIQVGSYKLRGGKRVFLMAPIHHHFEKKGLSETKVVTRFWIVSMIFMLIGLMLIKIK